MFSEDLFNNVLIQPAHNGANNLFIVSGYASAAMAFHHLNEVHQYNDTVNIKLIIGMTPQDGLSLSNHRALQKLVEEDFTGLFECSYIVTPPPVHSKVYVWFQDNEPNTGFIGSANYTQRAFGNYQREIMSNLSAEQGIEYFNSLSSDSLQCNNPDADNLVRMYNERYYARRQREITQPEGQENLPPDIQGLEYVRTSFLDMYGNLPQRSGLNWGQRQEFGREPNQAYIRLSSDIYNTDFFPERGQHFTVFTDDGSVLICTRAQDSAKAIETPHNNSLIGEYFRNRIDIPLGHLVSLDDLLRYGRTDVDFYKIDDETYYMDFSMQEDG